MGQVAAAQHPGPWFFGSAAWVSRLPFCVFVLNEFSTWMAFRLPHIVQPVFIPWDTLRPQFGVGINVKRNFPSVMRDDLMLALSVYEKARVDIVDRGVMLHPSPPPVQRRPLVR